MVSIVFFLKADYVINSKRVAIVMQLQKIPSNTQFDNIRSQANSYRKQIRLQQLPLKLQLKYLIATKMRFIYMYKIAHDNKLI